MAKLRLQYVAGNSALGLSVGPTSVVTGTSSRGEPVRETLIAAEVVGEWRWASGVTFRLASGMMRQRGNVEGWPLFNAGAGYAF